MNSRVDLAPIAAILMFACILAGGAGSLHYLQSQREQARRAQCAGGLKPLRISLAAAQIRAAQTPVKRDWVASDLATPALIEACLAEMEADDA
jgi:hypothetical protein